MIFTSYTNFATLLHFTRVSKCVTCELNLKNNVKLILNIFKPFRIYYIYQQERQKYNKTRKVLNKNIIVFFFPCIHPVNAWHMILTEFKQFVHLQRFQVILKCIYMPTDHVTQYCM